MGLIVKYILTTRLDHRKHNSTDLVKVTLYILGQQRNHIKEMVFKFNCSDNYLGAFGNLDANEGIEQRP